MPGAAIRLAEHHRHCEELFSLAGAAANSADWSLLTSRVAALREALLAHFRHEEERIFPLYEVEDGVVRHYGKTKAIVEGRPRKPVREYLLKQGRFAHFTEEDLDYFQSKIDEMWDKWEIPGVVPFWKEKRPVVPAP